MVEFQKGQGGAGNKLIIDLSDIIRYGINLLDIQLMLTRLNVPRIDRGQEPRIWIRYASKYIGEIGAEEINSILQGDMNMFNQYEQNTIEGINNFIKDNLQTINQLLA